MLPIIKVGFQVKFWLIFESYLVREQRAKRSPASILRGPTEDHT